MAKEDFGATANSMTKFLASLLDIDEAATNEFMDFWESLKIYKPVVNNVVVEIPSGKQYVISIKPVSK